MTKGCSVSVVHDRERVGASETLGRFRWELYGCLTRRADALLDLVDAVR
jgi:hypothetical protein